MAYSGINHTGFADAGSVPGMFREVVGLFTNTHDLQDAIRDLEGTAFPRQDISVMGSRHELDEVFGVKAVNPRFAMDNADTPRQAPARPEEETIGSAALVGGSAYVGAMAMALSAGAVAFPAAVAAVVIGGVGGASLGGILNKLLGDRASRHVHEQIEQGGLLLWVRTPDPIKESLARQLMENRNATEVHVHEIV